MIKDCAASGLIATWMNSGPHPLFGGRGGGGLHPWHMEVPRLGVQSELQLLAYAIATATPAPSRICDLRCSLRQRQILNLWMEARCPTGILVDTMSGS